MNTTIARVLSAARGLPLRRAPLSAALLGALLVGTVVGLAEPGRFPGRSELTARIGTGVRPLDDGRWWTVFTAALGNPGPLTVLLAALILALLAPYAERGLGAARMLALLVGGQVVGTLVVLGAVAATAGWGGWPHELAREVVATPLPGVFAVLLGWSATLSALGRRRLRLLACAALVVPVLYSGQLVDVIAFAGGMVGLVVGPLLRGRGRIARLAASPSRAETRVLVALVVAVSAIGPLVAALAQAPIGPLSTLRFVFLSPPPDAVTVAQICQSGAAENCRELQARLRLSGVGPAILSIVPVLVLLTVAEGLRRGRRAALIVGLVTNAVLTALGVALTVLVATVPDERRVVFGGPGGTRELLALALPAAVPLVVFALLVLTRRRFPVRAPRGTYRRVGAVVGLALPVLCAVSVLAGYALRAGFDRQVGFGALIADLPTRFLPPGYLGEVRPRLLPATPATTVLVEWTGVVFWLVVCAALLWAFLRPAAVVSSVDADEVRALLRRGGSDIGHLATWQGSEHWLCATGDAGVAYRRIGSVALTVGDPFGEPDRTGDVIRGFVAHCAEHGWTPCLYSVGADSRVVTDALGWSAVQVAEETLIALPGLEFRGKRWQDVRTALNGAGKHGIVAQWVDFASAPWALVEQVRSISEEWVADKGLPEMGFTLGGLDEMADPDVATLLAVDADGRVHGVTSWLPVYRGGVLVGRTLDVMRRRGAEAGGFRGVMEFLIATAALAFRDEGLEFASLSGAPLARSHDDEGRAHGLQRLLDTLGRTLEPVYGFRSLLAFKAKFQPTHEPWFLLYPDPVALPAIAHAVGRAYLPDLTAGQVTRLVAAVRS